MKRAAIATGLLGVLLATVFAQDQNRFAVAGVNEREVEFFFTAFKEAVAKGQKQRVASMVSFPIGVSLASGRRVKVRNSARFLKLYDQIFDAKFKQSIASTEFKDLWAKFSGVATPRGEIWINGILKNEKYPDQYEIKITTINGPIDR
jgi:hypothetical protein